MKILTLMILSIAMLSGCGGGSPTKAKITDIRFEKVLQEKFIFTQDGEIEFTGKVRTTLELDLGEKGISSIEGIQVFRNLETLSLYGNQLTEVKGLEKLTNLKTLFLRDNQLTDVKGLEKLTKLEVLNLKDNSDLTKAQIAELQKALPKCKIYSDHDC